MTSSENSKWRKMGPYSKHVPITFLFPLMSLNNFQGQNARTSKTMLACCQRQEYLEVVDNVLALKKSHSYYCQLQMQLAVIGYSWCDFFSMHDKRILSAENYFDKSFWLVNKCKLEILILLKFDTEIRIKLFFNILSE